MKKFLQAIIALLLLAYPFLVYFGLSTFSPRLMGLILGGFIIIRYLLINRDNKLLVTAGIIIGILIASVSDILNNAIMIKLYPVMMSCVMLLIFLLSLKNPPSIIARLAEKFSKIELTQDVINYTNKVTVIWCGFFIINALIALWTIYIGSDKIWMLYNGFVSYLLMGLLLTGEFAVRFMLQRRGQHE